MVVIPGAVLVHLCRTLQDDPRSDLPEYFTGHQLPGVSVKEKLAEREGTLHQEYHGKICANLLTVVYCYTCSY